MTIGVYGLGRFGSFWAGMLATRARVLVCSRSSHEVPAGTARTSLEGLGDCDAIFLCPAISAIPEVCSHLAPVLHSGQVVLDTCSVKTWPLEQMDRLLPPEVTLLGTHPMFGPDSARQGWKGLPLVLSPLGGSRDTPAAREALLFWQVFFHDLDLSVQTMSPADHDREAARTQGLTHLVGRILARMDLGPSDMATLGYRKLLEVTGQTCNDPWQLFLDLQGKNPYTDGVRKQLKNALDTVYSQLEAGIGSVKDKVEE